MNIIFSENDLNKDLWDRFVYDHPQGSIFQTADYYLSFKNSEKSDALLVALVGKQNSEILGILVAIIYHEGRGIKGYFSKRSIVMGGPLVKENSSKIASLLLDVYIKKIKKKVIYSQFRSIFGTDSLKCCFEKSCFTYEERLDIIVDLTKSVQHLLSDVHKERKRNISRAVNKGVTFIEIETEDEIIQAIELIDKTYKRIKLPLPPPSLFIRTKEVMGDKLRFFGASFQNKLIASRIVFCYKNLVYDWYAGSDDDYRNKYPNDFLPWNVILWSKEHKYETFIFGGAGKPGVPYGVRDYKMKFGGELISPFRYTKIHNRLLMGIGKLGYAMFKKI